MIARALFALLLLLPGPAAVAAGSPAGRYRLTGEQDVASELVLLADGRFRYFLMAGALDEHAEGRWIVEGGNVRLTTDPRPAPPVFSAGPSGRTDEAPLTLIVRWPDGRGIAGVDVRVGFDSGDAVEGYTQDYGWSLPAGEARTPRWVELAVPMHGLASPRFAIGVAQANALSFILTPNDLGVVDFRDNLVEVEPGRLVMHRGGGVLNYVPAGE